MDEPPPARTPPASTSTEWPAPKAVAIPRTGDERTLLVAFLDHYRELFALKCDGVPTGSMSERTCPPSTMTLHGLTRHLAGVERWWFAISFAGLDLPMLHYTDEDPDQDFERLDGDPHEALREWRAECDRSRRIVAACGDLDQVGVLQSRGPFTLRWLMLHLIAEYAQHLGHVDLLREGIDGTVGC